MQKEYRSFFGRKPFKQQQQRHREIVGYAKLSIW